MKCVDTIEKAWMHGSALMVGGIAICIIFWLHSTSNKIVETHLYAKAKLKMHEYYNHLNLDPTCLFISDKVDNLAPM